MDLAQVAQRKGSSLVLRIPLSACDEAGDRVSVVMAQLENNKSRQEGKSVTSSRLKIHVHNRRLQSLNGSYLRSCLVLAHAQQAGTADDTSGALVAVWALVLGRGPSVLAGRGRM